MYLLYVTSSRELWERKPLLLKRHRPYYNNGLFSCAELDQILREVTISVMQCNYNEILVNYNEILVKY